MNAYFAATLPVPNIGLASVRAALATFGCNQELVDAITNKNVSSMNSLSLSTNSDIKTLAKILSSIPIAQGACKIHC